MAVLKPGSVLAGLMLQSSGSAARDLPHLTSHELLRLSSSPVAGPDSQMAVVVEMQLGLQKLLSRAISREAQESENGQLGYADMNREARNGILG